MFRGLQCVFRLHSINHFLWKLMQDDRRKAFWICFFLPQLFIFVHPFFAIAKAISTKENRHLGSFQWNTMIKTTTSNRNSANWELKREFGTEIYYDNLSYTICKGWLNEVQILYDGEGRFECFGLSINTKLRGEFMSLKWNRHWSDVFGLSEVRGEYHCTAIYPGASVKAINIEAAHVLFKCELSCFVHYTKEPRLHCWFFTSVFSFVYDTSWVVTNVLWNMLHKHL